MSLPGSPVLQQLHRLNKSSSDFHDQLCKVLYAPEYVQCGQNLGGDDSVWLIDYFEEVRRHVVPPRSPFKPPVYVVWKRLKHPNIVHLLGITITPLQLISDWMLGGDLPEYVKQHPDVDRLGLVSLRAVALTPCLLPLPAN